MWQTIHQCDKQFTNEQCHDANTDMTIFEHGREQCVLDSTCRYQWKGWKSLLLPHSHPEPRSVCPFGGTNAVVHRYVFHPIIIFVFLSYIDRTQFLWWQTHQLIPCSTAGAHFVWRIWLIWCSPNNSRVVIYIVYNAFRDISVLNRSYHVVFVGE